MHEMAITCSIVEIVSEAARGRQVIAVTLDVGKLSCITPSALAFCFDVAAKGTVLENARLDIIDGRARCSYCGAEFAAPSVVMPCACASHDLRWLRGQVLKIKSMELAAETV
jgi:hydrogenase nickel incorporation protein HypA/HybF